MSIMKSITDLKKTMNIVDPKLASIFLPWAIRNPRYLCSFYRLKRTYNKSNKSRRKELENGIKIPPFLILSITQKCNLSCYGCYAAATGTTSEKKTKKSPLNWEEWYKIIKEASKLGVFGFVIVGGEPFLFPQLLELCKEFKDRFFIILTNGTLLKKEYFKQLKKLGNVAVLVSIEGGSYLTDRRRGKGVYENAINTIKQLNKIGTINGVSITITRTNYKYWMNHENINHLIDMGVRIGVFIEHIPITSKKEDKELMLTTKQRKDFRTQILNYRNEKPIYIVHSPGDEEFFGGCVSAGRGFAHITPAGDLTPCPISNISTHNLTKSTLYEGLASPLFKEIRKNEHLLETEGMPCALFAHPKEVDEIAKSVGAYRTDMDLE